MSELSTRYQANEIEQQWYNHWESKGYFRSKPDQREPFTIVIPPPNVTGMLHMGHMLNNTIQDILIRKARMEGKNACWVPGTDHASIATEAKVVRMLRERGIKKADLSREQFLEYAWEWKNKYGGIILQQLRKLGASCDWDRTRFTMEPKLSAAVIKVFVDLYHKGKIYRGLRMINWDPEARTVLSNEEVIYSNEQSKLYKVRYQIAESNEWITIATTRPETILGDTAIAVHPSDERYQHLHGKQAIVPLIGRQIPIIADTYVTMDFGSGALKVTPAHDVNDYEIGLRHGLQVIDILNDNGTLSPAAQLFVGLDRFEARKQILLQLQETQHLVAAEDYLNNVGRSERTQAVIEPKLSLQWYVDMKKLAAPALDAVMDGTVTFAPEKFKNVYNHWMSNIREWCISRQLWWGQRVPAYYYQNEVFVAETPEQALQQAQQKFGNHIQLEHLRQDDDVLDTWFSSWLWPISVFDGFESDEELKYYYPTNVLVTGWDIIFLWVARMIMAGYEWQGKRPFQAVYFTGMVRDKQRRKMSKQLGNSPDPLHLIEQYGADAVRYGLMSSSPAGGDLLYDEKLVEHGRNFANKLWNATRLVKGWTPDPNLPTPDVNKVAIQWFEHKLNQTVTSINADIENFRLSEALVTLYSFIWDDFCAWYLEMVKPDFGAPLDAYTHRHTLHFFTKLMTTLHPFMPFVTEEIWHQLQPNTDKDCMMSTWHVPTSFDLAYIEKIDWAKDVIAKIRDIRNRNGISPKEVLPLFVEPSPRSQDWLTLEGLQAMLIKMANLSAITLQNTNQPNATTFMAFTEKCSTIVNKTLDKDEMRQTLTKELEQARSFVASVQAKLNNERFVSGAPAETVERERKKLADGNARIKALEESIAQL
jgi:valyl-tRNA synthetase